MRYRFLATMLSVCLLAGAAQTLTVAKLVQFLQSSAQIIKEGKMTDKEVANYLSHAKMSERLDDRTIEDIQGRVTLGPKTIAALRLLRDESAGMVVGKGLEAEVKPKPIPPPSSEEQAAIIGDIREYALNYSKNLPDFICTQVTRRYAAPRPGTKYGGGPDSEPSWIALDVLQMRLSYINQKEEYKLILINNRLTNQDYHQIGGATATGDFGSMLLEIFEPSTEARFEWDHWATLRGQRVMAFGYHVSQARSQWHIVYERSMDIVPAYHGLVEVDPNTHVVLRVTLEADNIPPSFPVRSAKTILDYDYQDISGRTFLLPLKSQVFMSDSEAIQKLDQEFRLYHKYSAESEVKYDTDPLPPLADDKTKESAALDCKDPKNKEAKECKQK
jgi:hypothetical protein